MHHGLTRFAAESTLKLRHIRHHAVDPCKSRRMRVRYSIDSQIFRSLIFAGPLRHADKEALIRREAVAAPEVLTLGLLFPRDIGEQRSTKIGDIFAAG